MAKRRREEQRILALSQAWHTAAFQRMKTLPSLDSLVRRLQTRGIQTRSEQLSTLQLLSARYGIPLQRMRLVRKDAA